MQKWEYQIIEIIKGEVETVNGDLISKTPIKGLSGGERFKLIDYFSMIGNEGWEIISETSAALLKNYTPNPQRAILLAKRPIQE